MRKKSIKVLFLSSTIHPFVEELARQLNTRDVETFLVYSDYASLKSLSRSLLSVVGLLSFTIKFISKSPQLIIKLVNIMLKYVISSPKRFLSIIYYLIIASLIYKLDSKHRFDLIHSFWIYPAGISAVLAKVVVNKPVVISVLGYDVVGERTIKSGFFREISKLALEEADAVIVAAEHHYLSLLKIANIGSKIYFTPVGIDTNKFNPGISGKYIRERYGVADSDIVVSFGPHLREPYGPEDFLQAASIISRHVQNVTFMLFGDGHLRRKLEKLSRDYSLKAIFTGKIPYNEMPLYYAASDIFCISSYAGQGVSALEAMASGKPVVGYKTGIIAIIDGVDGFLAKEGDVKELAEKILILIRNPDLRKAMGESAREKVLSQHSIAACANRILEIYFSVLKNNLNALQ